MKNTFKYIFVAVAFSAMAFMSDSSAFAQNLPDGVYLEKDGLAYRKTATLKEGTTDKYIIDLETFVTGEVTVKNTSIPADIVLVLDVSGSMDEDMVTNVVARESQSYSYDSYGNSEYYFLYNNGYYKIERYQDSYGYYLRFKTGTGNNFYQDYRYLLTNGSTTTWQYSESINSTSATLFTGVLYEGDAVNKLDALKTAVEGFIDQILYNDMYDENGDRRKDKDGNDTYLGNQISIVKFAMNSYVSGNAGYNSNSAPLTVGNDFDNNGYNRTQVVKAFTPTSTGAGDLKTAVSELTAAGATAADYGLNLARLLINNLGEDRSGSAKTVVFFTDGSPTHQNSFDTTVATQAISNSKSMKDAGVTVFTVGVFDEETEQMRNFMNYTSSNYPTASSYSQPGNPVSTDATKLVYYQNASGADLSAVFKSIADVSGGSGNTEVTAESTVTVDVVASSFALPENVKPSDITVKVAPCTGLSAPITYGGETKRYLTFGEAKEATQYGLPAITASVDKAANTVSTEGFDFSENWCVYDEEHEVFHGYKQIISFEITVAEGAVGGPNVATNDKKSGIYVNGKQIAEFNRPTVKIPVSIWIKKMGLVGEDAAVFTISYANYQSGVDPMSIPSSDWKNFTKIMITSDSPKDTDGCPMEKLVGLDPDYFYRIKEDAWAWSYSYQDGGIQYTVGENLQNPFIFVNTPKEDIKEGEATVRNTFKKKEKTTTTTEEPEQPGGSK